MRAIYSVVMRATTAPDWERENRVGKVTSYTLPDVPIDDIGLGVRAVDLDGNQSLVAPYPEAVRKLFTEPVTAAADKTTAK